MRVGHTWMGQAPWFGQMPLGMSSSTWLKRLCRSLARASSASELLEKASRGCDFMANRPETPRGDDEEPQTASWLPRPPLTREEHDTAFTSTNPLTLGWRAQASVGTPNASWFPQMQAAGSGAVADMRLGTQSGNWAVAPMDPRRHLEPASIEAGGYISGLMQRQFGSYGSHTDIHGEPLADGPAHSIGPTDREGWQYVSGCPFKVQKHSGVPHGGIKFGARGYLHLKAERSELLDGDDPDRLFVCYVKDVSDTQRSSLEVAGCICQNPRRCMNVGSGCWKPVLCVRPIWSLTCCHGKKLAVRRRLPQRGSTRCFS